MSKGKRILCIFLILALVIGGVCFWQRNNLRALYLSVRMSQEELSSRMEEQKARTEAASREAGVDIRGLTEEEQSALRDELISRDELIRDIAESNKTQAEASTEEEASLRDQLTELFAELYVMQAEYTVWLENANQAAIDDFNALPEEERSEGKKFSIGMEYLQKAKEKEAECDAKMDEMERKIRDILTQLGESTAVVDEIHATYLEEKATKKAYYLGLH